MNQTPLHTPVWRPEMWALKTWLDDNWKWINNINQQYKQYRLPYSLFSPSLACSSLSVYTHPHRHRGTKTCQTVQVNSIFSKWNVSPCCGERKKSESKLDKSLSLTAVVIMLGSLVGRAFHKILFISWLEKFLVFPDVDDFGTPNIRWQEFVVDNAPYDSVSIEVSTPSCISG